MKYPSPAVVASFPTPNYVNPETRGNALVIFNSVFLGVASIVLILRLYTRLAVRKWFGWDDAFIILAYLNTVGTNVTVDIGVLKYCWNRHVYDIPLNMITPSLRTAYWAKFFFLNASFFTVCSLLAFYYRLISESGRTPFRTVLHCATVFNVIAWLPFLLSQMLMCIPVYEYWAFPQSSSAKCQNEGKATLAGGVVKTFVDLLITTLPIPLILRMNMEKKQRYGVVLLLSLGYLTTAAGALRTYYTWKIFFDSNDVTWWQYPGFMAAVAENNIGLITTCIPTLRPLFPHLLGGPLRKLRNWTGSYKSGSSSNRSAATTNNTKHSSKIRSKVVPVRRGDLDSRASENPSDIRLVIQRNESFELNETPLDEKGGQVDLESDPVRTAARPFAPYNTI